MLKWVKAIKVFLLHITNSLNISTTFREGNNVNILQSLAQPVRDMHGLLFNLTRSKNSVNRPQDAPTGCVCVKYIKYSVCKTTGLMKI